MNHPQEQQILLAILEEMRSIRQSVEQQALLSAHASRSQEYGLLHERFRHLLPPTNGLGGAPDLANMWMTMRGTSSWREHLSPDQLGLLLCRDERMTFVLDAKHLDVPEGFVEEVLSRLPRLEQCTVRGMRCPTNFAALQTVPAPFPALQSINLEATAVTDADLMYLALLCPQLRAVHVSNCPHVTLQGIAAARQRNPALVVTPATEESKQLEDAQRELDAKLLDFTSDESKGEYERLMARYGKHLAGFERECALDKQLYALWMELGGTHGWRRELRPAQLSLLLSRLESVTESYLQVRADHYVPRSRQKPARTIDANEIVGFVSQVLSRLPKLVMMQVWDCPRWPLDWSSMYDVHRPFCSLWYAHIRHTPYSVADLMETSTRLKPLMELRVEADRLPSTANRITVADDCEEKVKFE